MESAGEVRRVHSRFGGRRSKLGIWGLGASWSGVLVYVVQVFLSGLRFWFEGRPRGPPPRFPRCPSSNETARRDHYTHPGVASGGDVPQGLRLLGA